MSARATARWVGPVAAALLRSQGARAGAAWCARVRVHTRRGAWLALDDDDARPLWLDARPALRGARVLVAPPALLETLAVGSHLRFTSAADEHAARSAHDPRPTLALPALAALERPPPAPLARPHEDALRARVRLARAALERLRLEAPPTPLDDTYRALRDAFARAIIVVGDDDDQGARERVATALLGAGDGLTPAGDDLLAGYLFARARCGLGAAAWTDALLVASRRRTHALSCALLVDAARGYAATDAHEALVAALCEGARPVAEALATLAAVGHTSGREAADGALLALEEAARSAR